MRHLLLLVAVVLMFGCTSRYRQDVIATPTAKLERGKSVVIATPQNGFYNDREYRASGRQTAAVVQSAFAHFTNKVVVNPHCSELSCLRKESRNYDYFVVPEILHWEDRNTEWSGIPDRVEVKLTLWDQQMEKEISAVVISGRSKWATFGGDHPQDLLPDPIRRHVQALY